MLTWQDFFATLLLPALVAALLPIAAWRATRRRMAARDCRSWALACALALGFVAGYLASFGLPELPPADGIEVILLAGVFLAAASLALALWQPGRPAGAVVILLVTAAAGALLARPLWPHQPAGWWLHAAIALAIAGASLVSLDVLAARLRAATLLAMLLVVSIASAIVLVQSGSARLAQMAVILAAAECGAWLAVVAMGRATTARAVVLVGGVLWALLLLAGLWYAELSSRSAIPLIAAPHAAWLAAARTPRQSRFARAVVQVLLVAAIAAIPVALALIEWPQAPH